MTVPISYKEWYYEKSYFKLNLYFGYWDINRDGFTRCRAKEFIKISDEKIERFDMDLFFYMVEKMTILDGKIVIRMLGGAEVE